MLSATWIQLVGDDTNATAHFYGSRPHLRIADQIAILSTVEGIKAIRDACNELLMAYTPAKEKV